MNALETTTLQEVRRFLTALGLAPSPYADSREVVDHLVATVRRHRHDPAMRARLQALIDRFADRADLGPSNLDVLRPEELAQALTSLLDDRPAAAPMAHSRVWTCLVAIAVLLIALALAGSCKKSDDDDDSSDAVCAEDVTAEHFRDLIGQSDDLTQAQQNDALEEYVALAVAEQQSVIGELCAMDAEDIAAYIEDKFGDDWTTDDDGTDDDTVVDDDDTTSDDDATPDDDTVDDDAVYKGVSVDRPRADHRRTRPDRATMPTRAS